MIEKDFIILFVLISWLIVLYIKYDCNKMMKKVRTELEEVGFEFDEKGDIK